MLPHPKKVQHKLLTFKITYVSTCYTMVNINIPLFQHTENISISICQVQSGQCGLDKQATKILQFYTLGNTRHRQTTIYIIYVSQNKTHCNTYNGIFLALIILNRHHCVADPSSIGTDSSLLNSVLSSPYFTPLKSKLS